MKSIIITLAIFVLTFTNSFSQQQPVDVFYEYLDGLKNPELRTGESFWDPGLLAKSNRLDISFIGTPSRLDCASPIIEFLDAIKSGSVKVTTEEATIVGKYAILPIVLSSMTETIKYNYYLEKNAYGWKLTNAFDVYASDWPVIETDYFNLYYNDTTMINQIAIDELDTYVETICGKGNLGLPHEYVLNLKNKKIDYYLCGKDDIKTITGHATEGMYDLASDALITRHLPHYHEIAHLCMNYAISDAHIYTLPVFREGFAVAMGGRWGKSKEVLFQLANFLLDNEIISIESMLTFDGFQTDAGTADMTYPIAGLYVDYLISAFGISNFYYIHMETSGKLNDLKLMSLEKIKSIIDKYCQNPKISFDEYRAKYKSSGIIHSDKDSTDKIVFDSTLNGYSFEVYEGEDDFEFLIDSDLPINGGTLLLKPKSAIDNNYHSWMFAEHFPMGEYHNERFGVQFDMNEITLYDYYLNIIRSKVIYSFTPDDKYITNDNKRIQFKIEKSRSALNFDDYKISFIGK